MRVTDLALCYLLAGAVLTAVLRARRRDLSPSDAWVLGFFGMISIFSGDLGEALTVLERAVRLSPQTIAWIEYHLGHAKAWAGDDAGAQASLQRYIVADPTEPWSWVMLALVHGFSDRTQDARAAMAEALRLQTDINEAQFRRAHRYRDPARLERAVRVLSAAGLPA